MTPRPALRAAIGCLLVLVLLPILSPVYRDFFLDRRDRYQGTSIADFLGPMAYDRRVLHDFSWGGWFWNPDKALGMPRMQDLGTRPMYPVQLALLVAMPEARAWHWNHVVHVALKAIGLVLLGVALQWPLWIVVAAATGAMVAEGSLVQFGDTTYLLSGAWLPLQLWLTLKAARRSGMTGWDAAWAVAAALAALSFHPQFGAYYMVLIGLVTLWVERAELRQRWPALVARYLTSGLLIAPWLLPSGLHYAESLRRHIAAFDDWHLARAYTWWKYRLGWTTLRQALLVPTGVWIAIGVALLVARVWRRARELTLWPPFVAYFVFGLFHAVPWLALPMWITGVAVLPFRIPERVFEPFTWLGILLLAELAACGTRGWRGAVLALLLVAGFGACLWQTAYDPSSGYIMPRWERQLPERLAGQVRAEPRAPAVFVTGTDRKPDDQAPLLNSHHNLILGVPAAHFLGEVPSYYFSRATYRVPGLLFMQRVATPLTDWDDVVDVYAELGIGWVFWDGAGEPIHPRLRLAGEERGFRLYRIDGARPHVYALDRVRRVPEPTRPADVAALVFSLPGLGPFCYGCPESATASPLSEVVLRSTWRAGDVTVYVTSPRGTLVVLGETRSRGWRASVDGRPVQIHPVDEMFQGVAVGPGQHRIQWTFESPGFFAGLWLLLLGICVLLVGIWIPRIRRERDARP